MKRILFISFLLCSSLSLLSADMNEQPVRFGISEAEKQVYTITTPISLQVNLHNNSAAPYLFELAGNKVFNIELTVTNMYNEPLAASENYIRERTSNQQVYYREVRILPGEEFSFYIDVNDFIDIGTPGIYYIEAGFSPDLGTEPVLRSNTLTVHVHPEKPTETDFDEIITFESERAIEKQKLPPDQVVEYMIKARQQEEWDNFFLYLDVEQLMLQNRLKEAEYRRSSDEQRIRMVMQYRDLLRNEEVDNDILMKPVDFTIEKTVYTSQNAEVRVNAEYRYPDYTEIRHYLYYLHRPDGYWTIYKYQVMGQETR